MRFALAFLSVAAQALAACWHRPRPMGKFEGIVEWSIKGVMNGTITITVKGDQARVDKAGPMQTSIFGMIDKIQIIDKKERRVTMLMPAQKKAWLMALPDEAKAKQMAGDIKVEHTGKKETILGCPTEEVVLNVKGQDVDMWLTDKLGEVSMGSFGGVDPLVEALAVSEVATGMFPMRVLVKTPAGPMTMEVTKIERKAVDASVFAVPPDYEKTEKPAEMLAVISTLAVEDVVTPAGGDPGGRRLKELSDDEVFAVLPEGAKMVEETRTPARYRQPAFQTGGWDGPSVVIAFKSSAPLADVYGFYARRAAAAGWRPIAKGGLGFTDRWSKTYPDGAKAWFGLSPLEPWPAVLGALAPKTVVLYHLDAGITPMEP
jgi:hypothetical protein